MLHLRVIAPGDCSGAAEQLLTESQAATNVVVLSGAALDPAGDVLMADVAREGASGLVQALTDLGIERRGSIAIEHVDMSLSDTARRAERRSPGRGADAVVWEEVEDQTSEESTLSWTFLGFTVLATLIAVLGIMSDQPILIVGAMVVGPEFGPLAGLCVSLVQRRGAEAARSLLALTVGFLAAIAVAAALTRVAVFFGWLTPAMFFAERPMTGFIAQPDVLSLLVALTAGIAGLLSLTSARSTALMGVVISVTTVPALGNIALALVFGDVAQLRGSTLQLTVNLVAIVVAGTLTLLGQKFAWSRLGPPRPRPGTGRGRPPRPPRHRVAS